MICRSLIYGGVLFIPCPDSDGMTVLVLRSCSMYILLFIQKIYRFAEHV